MANTIKSAQHISGGLVDSQGFERDHEEPRPQPLLLKAAFSLETVAHLQGFEVELLPQAEHLRKVHEILRQMPTSNLPEVTKAAIKECLK